MIDDPTGVPYGAGLTPEQRLARLEQRLGVAVPAAPSDGLEFVSDSAVPGGGAWKSNPSGILVPNAAVGTDKVQFTSGSAWSPMFYAGAMKIGAYFSGANLVTSSGAQWVEILRAGMYIFEVNVVITRPSSSVVGYGLTTEVTSNAGTPYLDAHNHEIPYNATDDYKTRTFLRRCAVGERIGPTIYYSAATGNVTFINQAATRTHFSFARTGD